VLPIIYIPYSSTIRYRQERQNSVAGTTTIFFFALSEHRRKWQEHKIKREKVQINTGDHNTAKTVQ